MKRRPLDFRNMDEVIAELDRLHAGGYEPGGNWNLAQVCNHLAIAVRGSLEGSKAPKPSWFMRMLAPVIMWWMFKKRRMPEAVTVPAVLLPHDVEDEAKEVEEAKQLLRRFQEHKGPLHPSPFAGNLSNDRWLDLHLIHCAHHLSFLHPK